ncbi:hypothetical protein D3C80_950070 [compost metagenome]
MSIFNQVNEGDIVVSTTQVTNNLGVTYDAGEEFVVVRIHMDDSMSLAQVDEYEQEGSEAACWFYMSSLYSDQYASSEIDRLRLSNHVDKFKPKEIRKEEPLTKTLDVLEAVPAGTLVRVVRTEANSTDHSFKNGTVARSLGHKWFVNHNGQAWTEFEDVENTENRQWLQVRHFELVELATPVVGLEPEALLGSGEIEVNTDLPQKQVFSVVRDVDGAVLLATSDRDYAREVKAGYGGKKGGVSIYAYAAVKEIR